MKLNKKNQAFGMGYQANLETNLLEYLLNCGFQTRIKGQEIWMDHCPYCESPGKTSDHFSFNQDKNVFHCVKCGESGTLYKFKLDRGDVNPFYNVKSYKKPPDKQLSAPDKFYEWYKRNRGIKKEILVKYKVMLENKCIVYQYFENDGTLFNRKYKEISTGKVWQEKDAKHNFYGLHVNGNPDKKFCIIVEGEDDVHAMVQMGWENVYGLPSGAGSYTPEMDKFLNGYGLIYVALDCDQTGQKEAKRFAEKAGLHKCKNVIMPFKDARDCLLNGVDIKKYIDQAKYFQHDTIRTIESAKPEYMDYIQNQQRLLGTMMPSEGINRVVGGIRAGETTLLLGHTGIGKTTFALNLMLWCQESELPVLLFPFEDKIVNVIRKLIEIITDEPTFSYSEIEQKNLLNNKPEWYEDQIDSLAKRKLYIFDKDKHHNMGYFDPQKIIETMRYAVKFYNIKVFCIDHLHYFLKLGNTRNPVYVIDETMRMFTTIAQELDVHILILVHAIKTQDKATGESRKLGINSAKGSGSIAQEAFNFWIIDRDENNHGSIVEIRKNRTYGKTGTILYKVSENLNTYIEDRFTYKLSEKEF